MDLKCSQCGGQVPIEEDVVFIRCPFCETALYVDASQTVKHFQLGPTVDLKDLGPLLQRRLAAMEIQNPVEIKTSRLAYFPFWRLDRAIGSPTLLPAAAPPLEDMAALKNPAGDLKLFSAELAERASVIEPTVLLEDAVARARAASSGPETLRFKSAAMVHLPLIEVDYVCEEGGFRAVVEAVSGEVYADDWPAAPARQKDRTLATIALLAFAVFLLEAALIPYAAILIPAYVVTGLGVYAVAVNKLKSMGW